MNKKPEIQLNFDLAIKRYKRDIRDDWFPDPLQYNDILDVKKIQEYFSANSEAYYGEKAEQFNLPKPGFILRYTLETSIYDRILFQAIIDKLIEIYDPLFHHRVYSHRLSKRSDKKYIFRHPIEAWKQFLQEIEAELYNTDKVLLVTDIYNYFECIAIDELKNALLRYCPPENIEIKQCILTLISLLKKWSKNQFVGIPQNRDPSSFLGNVYLHVVDEVMLIKDYNYFRYMDDIRIVCDDQFHARKALLDLTVELRDLRLNVNSKKTEILQPDVKNPEYTQFMPLPNRTVEEIDALLNERKLSSARKVLPKLKLYTHQLIVEQKTNEREFRFCINRLERIARCKELGFDFTGIIDPVIGLLESQPWSTDSVSRLLRSVDLSDEQVLRIVEFVNNEKKNIYDWQGYLCWQLIATIYKCRGEKSRKLSRLAIKTLNGNWNPPMKAGAILYLGACGTQNDRLFILKNFNSINSRLLLRSVLIATHEVPKTDAVRYLYTDIDDNIRESYEFIRSPSFASRYFEPLPSLSASELFDDLPEMYPI